MGHPFLKDLARSTTCGFTIAWGVLIALGILDAMAALGAMLGTAGVVGFAIGFSFRETAGAREHVNTNGLVC